MRARRDALEGCRRRGERAIIAAPVSLQERTSVLSLKAASAATGVALVLGTMAALAVSRFQFFGRETLSFLFVLPIALPGVITGIALSSVRSSHSRCRSTR